MTTEQMWSAIRDLDPGAEIRYMPPGGWSVRLTNLYYQALDRRSLVTALKAPSRQTGHRAYVGTADVLEQSVHPVPGLR